MDFRYSTLWSTLSRPSSPFCRPRIGCRSFRTRATQRSSFRFDRWRQRIRRVQSWRWRSCSRTAWRICGQELESEWNRCSAQLDQDEFRRFSCSRTANRTSSQPSDTSRRSSVTMQRTAHFVARFTRLVSDTKSIRSCWSIWRKSATAAICSFQIRRLSARHSSTVSRTSWQRLVNKVRKKLFSKKTTTTTQHHFFKYIYSDIESDTVERCKVCVERFRYADQYSTRRTGCRYRQTLRRSSIIPISILSMFVFSF